MKLSYILTGILASTLLFSCNRTIETAEEETVKTEKIAVVANDQVDLKVEGMVCVNGCKGAIEKSLNGMAGIDKCDIDFEKGIAHVSFDNNQISNSEIKTAIEAVNEGAYSAEIIEIVEEEEAPQDVEQVEVNTAS
ncbi:MAG: cation transporter [Schleiferiaceae bacterium]|jgi:copper chaperone CopZ|nr:cation transporter [Schleiferiaceae bacterium]